MAGYYNPGTGAWVDDATQQRNQANITAHQYDNGVSPDLVGKGATNGMTDIDFARQLSNIQSGVMGGGDPTQAKQFATQNGLDYNKYFTHKQSFLQKADPYIAGAAMGALSMGAMGGFAAGGAGAGSGTGAGTAAGYNAGADAFTGDMIGGAGWTGGGAGGASGSTAWGAGAGGAAMTPASGAGSGGSMGGSGYGTSAPSAGPYGTGAADYTMPGAEAASGGAPAQAGGGNFLSGMGNALDMGSAGKNIATYGPVVFGGLEYANARDATKAYQDQLNKQIQMSDPFGPERAKYQQQLDELMRDPSTFLNSPQVQFASDAAARKMSSMGYNQSPAQAKAIADASIGQYYKQADLLASLSGSQISPNSNALNTAGTNLINSRLGGDAALGNVSRQTLDALFSTGGSGKSGTNGGDSGTKVGDRAFSYLDTLV